MTHNKKTLAQWITKIESFHPNEIELGLERITQVAHKLNLINQTAKIIIVGGTNGKGSCVATLESLALGADLKIGCYTSPHLLKFNERIRINGKDVSDQILQQAFEIIDRAREKLALTFFEFTTLVALLVFKQAFLELVVLEVGLGGRLDAVNMVEPDATIITTIDFDHQFWLGNRLQDIAFEKSGICRKGIDNFVGDPQSFDLILNARPEYCRELTLIEINDSKGDRYKPLFDLVSDDSINPHRLLLQNLMLAIRAFEAIFPDEFFRLDLAEVISHIQIKGRFQKISNRPLMILDVGHNVQAAKNLVTQIKKLEKNQVGKKIAICGLMADKAIGDYLSIMDEVIDEWYFVDLPLERAETAKNLLKNYRNITNEKQVYTAQSVFNAQRQMESKISKDDRVFIFGSFITVAEMLKCKKINANKT